MAQPVRDLMSDPVTVTTRDTVTDAANLMRATDVGFVVVVDGLRPVGVLTDRDIVVRAVALGYAPQNLTTSELCSADLSTVAAGDDVARAVDIMRDKAIRRLPVVDGARLVGVISLGDVARHEGDTSALAAVRAHEPNL